MSITDREVHRIGLDKSCRPRFTTLTALEGFEVIDLDGRTVDHRPTRQSANGRASVLNRAAAASPRALQAALIRL